ncbi:MAG: PQQ-binding-like beta-propeller repeat protein [Dehalococcoidales bacterium]|nr:PQQ-binding-like beta-propeller repeat protein [Dehalococcoidales bacterium]
MTQQKMFEESLDVVLTREEVERRRRVILKRRRIIWGTVLGVVLAFALFLVLYHSNVLFGLSPVLESVSTEGNWALFRYDPGRTGAVNAGNAVASGRLKWSFATGGAIHSSPAVVNGVVYFGSRDGNIYALNASTGEKIWSFKTGSWVESSPVVVNGVVYCGSNDGSLYALDAASGQKLWSFATRYAVRSSPAVAGGKVYIGSDDYCLYALDAATGRQLWKFEADNLIISSPVVTGGVVLVGSSDGSVYALNAENGRRRLQFYAGSPVVASPAVANGTVYIANSDGSLVALDPKARNWLWENKLIVYWRALYVYGVAPKPPLPSGLIWGYNLKGNFGCSPAVYDNNIYVSSGTSFVSLKLGDNKKISEENINWRLTLSDLVVSSPAVTERAIYFGCNNGRLYAIDRVNGIKLWDFATGDKVTSSPAVVGGTVYFGSQDGILYAIE